MSIVKSNKNYTYKTLIINGNSSLTPSNVITQTYANPFQLKNAAIMVKFFAINYSWFNVTAAYGNQTVSYIFNGVTRNITFPPGFYAISDISAYIQLQMVANGDYLVDQNGNNVFFMNISLNTTYYSATLTCTPIPASLPTGWTNPHSITLSGNTPQLVVTNAKWGLLIGFTTGTYPAVTQSSIFQANSNTTPVITNVTAVNISANIAATNYYNPSPQAIEIFTPDVAFANQIQITNIPTDIDFVPCADGSYDRVTLTLTDQMNNPLGNNDNQITIKLILRYET